MKKDRKGGMKQEEEGEEEEEVGKEESGGKRSLLKLHFRSLRPARLLSK